MLLNIIMNFIVIVANLTKRNNCLSFSTSIFDNRDLIMDYNYYNADDYPLNRYCLCDIPSHLHQTIYSLIVHNNCIIRGGLAYILLTNDFTYYLKDIDLLADRHQCNEIFSFATSVAEKVFYSKNSHKVDLLTLFWKRQPCYDKIDVLFLESQTSPIDFSYINSNIFPTAVPVIAPVDLWFDRIAKIAEKELRRHSDAKTMNHVRVAVNMSKYLLNKHIPMPPKYSLDYISSYIERAVHVLTQMTAPDDETIQEFQQLSTEALNQK